MTNHKTMRAVSFGLALGAVWSDAAYAYIDPGTGGYVVQSLWPAIAGFFALGLVFLLRFFRLRRGNFFRGFKKNRRRILVLIALTAVLAGVIFLVKN